MPRRRNWLITGVSSGLGVALADAALARGDLVIGTVRDPAAATRFDGIAPGRSRAIQLDLADAARIPVAVEEALTHAGAIDILVNNAGRGMTGAVEEQSDDEARLLMDINFFGPLRMIRALLPHMRTRGGTIVNVSSAGGLCGFAGIGLYCATKGALENLTEALEQELAPFGVSTLLVEPGALRTDFSGRSICIPATPLACYDDTPAGRARAYPARLSGSEIGDPAKAAAAILAALDAEAPPRRLVLGSDALATLRAKAARLVQEADDWSELSRSTDIPGQRAFDFSARRDKLQEAGGLPARGEERERCMPSSE